MGHELSVFVVIIKEPMFTVYNVVPTPLIALTDLTVYASHYLSAKWTFKLLAWCYFHNCRLEGNADLVRHSSHTLQ